MKRIELEQDEVDALENLVNSGSTGVAVLKKIIKLHIEELESVRNIDPKGNMGLQTLARQNALEIVEDIAKMMFPDAGMVRSRTFQPQGASQPISPYR